MEFTGIIKVLSRRDGVSQSSGKPWVVQEYMLDMTPPHVGGMEFPIQSRIVFDVFGDEKIRSFAMQDGERVTVSLDFNAREYNGRYINSVRCWKVVRPQYGAAPQPVAQPVAQPAPLPANSAYYEHNANGWPVVHQPAAPQPVQPQPAQSVVKPAGTPDVFYQERNSHKKVTLTEPVKPSNGGNGELPF